MGFRKSEPQQKDHHKAETSTAAVHQDSRNIENGASTIGESDNGGSDTIARVHACRLLHAPRDAIPVPCADQAPLEYFTALTQQREPAAPLRRRQPQPS